MEGTSSAFVRRIPAHAGYARIQVFAEFIAAGWRILSGWAAAFAAAQRSARSRHELHNLSDRSLKDIGLDRHQIDRLFH